MSKAIKLKETLKAKNIDVSEFLTAFEVMESFLNNMDENEGFHIDGFLGCFNDIEKLGGEELVDVSIDFYFEQRGGA